MTLCFTPRAVMCSAALSHDRLFAASQTPVSMGTLQARMLEGVAMPFSRRSSQPRGQTQVSHIAGRCFTIWATREYMEYMVFYKYILKRSPGLDKELSLNPTLFLASFVTFSKLLIIDIVI